MGVGHDFGNGCEWCAHGCGCWVWCWTCGHVATACGCAVGVGVGVGVWVLVLGGVVVGVGVGVWVKWSSMAVASRLMGVNGVGCGCGHRPMLGGVVVGVVRCGNVGRTSPIATGMGSPPQGIGQGAGVWDRWH